MRSRLLFFVCFVCDMTNVFCYGAFCFYHPSRTKEKTACDCFFHFPILKEKNVKTTTDKTGRVRGLSLSFGLLCGVNVRLLQLLNTFISPKNVVFLPQIQWNCVFHIMFWLSRGPVMWPLQSLGIKMTTGSLLVCVSWFLFFFCLLQLKIWIQQQELVQQVCCTMSLNQEKA